MSTPTATALPTTEFAVSADGTRIAFERTGSGPLVVLIDGALCYRDFGPARAVARELADAYTVVSYDRRGRGESGDTAPYAVEREFEDLAAVVTAAAGGGRADAYLLGQSSGAALGYRATAAGIVTPRKIIGYEAPWVGLRPGKDGRPRDYTAELEALVRDDEPGKAVGYFMVKMVAGPWFLPVMMRLMPKVWKQLKAVAPTLPNDAHIMGAQFTVPTDEIARITVPTLVLAGSKAPPAMLAAQASVAATVAGAEHRILDGQRHDVAPAALAAEARGFFR
jgi:pimeloyl-ACP methyl ester carboxylesterase